MVTKSQSRSKEDVEVAEEEDDEEGKEEEVDEEGKEEGEEGVEDGSELSVEGWLRRGRTSSTKASISNHAGDSISSFFISRRDFLPHVSL